MKEFEMANASKNAIAMRRGAIRFGKTMQIFIGLAALAVFVENVRLLQNNRRLQEAVAPQITSGAHVEMLGGLGFDGRFQPLPMPAANSKLLIITFSPACPACQANQQGWKKLVAVLEQKGVRVLWVSRDPLAATRDYCTQHGIRLSDTFADPPHRTYVQLGLARVPNTILLGAGGAVEKVWAGRLDEAGWNSLFAYFGESEKNLYPPQVKVGVH